MIMRTGFSALRGATFLNSVFTGMEQARWRVPLALSTPDELTSYDQPTQQDHRGHSTRSNGRQTKSQGQRDKSCSTVVPIQIRPG